jgi:hypothetical protein
MAVFVKIYNQFSGYYVRTFSLILAFFIFTSSSFANVEENKKTVEVSTFKPHWSKLPFLAEEVHKRGYELPLPIGFSFVYNFQEVDYKAEENFQVKATGGVLGCLGQASPALCLLNSAGKSTDYTVPKDDVSITGEDKSFQFRADVWVLPFLNLFLVAGATDGTKQINAKLDNVSQVSGICSGLANIGKGCTLPIPLEYEAANFGGGIVLAGQVDLFKWTEPIVFTFMGMGTNAWTDMLDSTIQMAVGQFKVGQRFNFFGDKLTYLVGYNYQFLHQDVGGTLNVKGTALEPILHEVDFKVKIENIETSNFALSLNYDFGDKDQWNIFTEYGFVNWKQWIFQFGRRF